MQIMRITSTLVWALALMSTTHVLPILGKDASFIVFIIAALISLVAVFWIAKHPELPVKQEKFEG